MSGKRSRADRRARLVNVGETYEVFPERMGPVPAGQHRWVGIVTYSLTAEELEREYTGRGKLTLHPTRVLGDVARVCLECEQPFTPSLADQPCPGEPS